MKEIVQNIWKGIVTPSARNEDEYSFLVIAIAHIMLGASFVWLGWFAIFIPLIYFIVKEIPDLMNGGSLLDSFADSFFLSVGLTYSGPVLWPIVILVTGVVGTVAFFWYRAR